MNAPQRAFVESEVDHIFERTIHDIGIPPCPDVLARFMAEMRKDEPDYGRLENIICADVSISAGLIKTANSPFFGLHQRARSGSDALAMLGMKMSSHVVAGIVLRNAFPQMPAMERFWDSSARTARLSGWLAKHLKIRGLRAEDAYTFGLFRDCGIPVLLGRFKNYEAVLDMANKESEQGFVEIEEAEVQTNHASVGWMLTQSWYLPKEICFAVASHHDLKALKRPMASWRLIAVAQLAEHIIQRQLGLGLTREWTKLGAASLQILGLQEDQLHALYAEAEPIVSAEE